MSNEELTIRVERLEREVSDIKEVVSQLNGFVQDMSKILSDLTVEVINHGYHT